MTSIDEHIPPGTMMLWAGGAKQYSAPSLNLGTIAVPGWLYCDGSTVRTDLYPALFATISTLYNTGAEPANTFRLPGPLGYMNKGTVNNSVLRVSTPATNHSHTAGAITAPGINYTLAWSGIHAHNYSASTTSTGNTHGHGNNAGCSANTAANVTRASGTANGHLQGHAHNSATNSAAGGGGHNHNFGAFRESSGENHAHTSPSIGATGGTSVTTVSHASMQPLISMWHIIKT